MAQGGGGLGPQDSRYGNKFVGGSSMGVGGPLIKGTKRSTRCIRDASGQLIIDQEEDNLSDKEMYARNVPAIGKQSCSRRADGLAAPAAPGRPSTTHVIVASRLQGS